MTAARERLRLLTEAAERELHGSSILRGHVELRGLTVMEARELLADLDGEWLNGYCPGCGKPNHPATALVAEWEKLLLEAATVIERMANGASRDECSPELDRVIAALERIAAPKRPDGTYNLSREACEQIAREALRRD